jgi:hypothetical protein
MSQSGQPRRALTIRNVAMPTDANANGDIFGGWVLGQMDISGDLEVRLPEMEVVGLMLDLANGRFSKPAFAESLRAQSVRYVK